jgi:hypothetical protein
MDKKTKKKIINRQLKKFIPVFIVLLIFILLILFWVSNLPKNVSFSPPPNVDLYGLPKDFTPVVSHVFADGQIGLWDSGGQYYVLKHSVGQRLEFQNKTLEIQSFPYNFPKTFKPILAYYTPFPTANENGRIDLWDAQGTLRSFRPSTSSSQGQSFATPISEYNYRGNLPVGFKPISGFFYSKEGGDIILFNASAGSPSLNNTFILNLTYDVGNFSEILDENYFMKEEQSGGDFPTSIPILIYSSDQNPCTLFRSLGDANGDSKLDSTDIDLIIAAINGNNYDACLDINYDGQIDDIDVIIPLFEIGGILDLSNPQSPYHEYYTKLFQYPFDISDCSEIPDNDARVLCEQASSPTPKYEYLFMNENNQIKILEHGFGQTNDITSEISGLPLTQPPTQAYYDSELTNFFVWIGKDAYVSNNQRSFTKVNLYYSCNINENQSVCLDSSRLEYCSSEGIITEKVCEYGCNSGVCNQPPVSQCIDSDSEIFGSGSVAFGAYNFGNVRYSNNGNLVIVEDYCINSTTLVEQLCLIQNTGGDIAGNITYGCPNGCESGSCKNPPSEICKDTDGGKIYNLKGNTGYEVNGELAYYFEDFCNSETGLVEFFCSNNFLNFTLYNCGTNNSCQQGACADISLKLPPPTSLGSSFVCSEGSWRCEQNASYLCQNSSWVQYPAGEGDCADSISVGKSILVAILLLLLILILIILSYTIYKLIKKQNEEANKKSKTSSGFPILKKPKTPPTTPPKPILNLNQKIPPKTNIPNSTSHLRVENRYRPHNYQPQIPKNPLSRNIPRPLR